MHRLYHPIFQTMIDLAEKLVHITNKFRQTKEQRQVDYGDFPVGGSLETFVPYLDAYEDMGYVLTTVTCEQEINHILCSIGLPDEMGAYGSLIVGDTSNGDYTLVLGVTSNHGRLDAYTYNLITFTTR